MQVNQPQGGSAEASTPRYDTIVIRGAKGETIPKEVDGGEVVAWSRGHELAAMDALEEFVDDLAAGNCSYPAELTLRAAEAMSLMHRRRDEGWEPDEQGPGPAAQPWTHEKPTQQGAYWIRGNLLQADALVQVKVVNGVLSCNLHQVNSDPGFDFGFTIEKLSDDFEWLGPLAPMGGR